MENLRKIKLSVILGDITQTPVDAIMTAINSEGLWYGGVDRAIQRVAGNMYHSQANARMPLKNLDVVVAKGDRREHTGQFGSVIFVVDDLISPVSEAVYTGLEAAHNSEYRRLAIPAVRMGVMAGVVEKTPQETVEGIVTGISNFLYRHGDTTKLEELTFVIYNDGQALGYLQHGFRQQHLLN